MSVLVLHAADHGGHFVKRAERGRPVGHGQTCVVTGDKRSSDNKQQRAAGGKNREAMEPAMVRHFDALQDIPQKPG